MKKQYIKPSSEKIVLSGETDIMDQVGQGPLISSKTAKKNAVVYAKHHGFDDNVGDDVWQRGNNNGFKSWEDE